MSAVRSLGLYEAYWGLREKPFENTPDPRFLYQSGSAATVYKLLHYALQNNRGAALLTGDSGCGKTLINIVSIFPLGSLVKLNNNEIGRVIGTSRLHPTRPQVEILLDSRGRPLKPPRQLVLEEEPMVYIVNPAIEEDVLKK